MISDAMKRNIPSVRASTRELWCATGGWPAWASACALTPAAPAARPAGCSRDRLRLAVDLDVIDGQPRLLAQAVDQVATQPARRLLTREGRDDDLVHALVLDGVCGGGEGVGVSDLPVDVDPLAAQDRQRAAQAPLGLRVRGRGHV